MGIAYLPDGSRIDYNDYIKSHPHWQKVRGARLKFDGGKCAMCHRDVREDFQTHHMTYTHLGHENLADVMTLCKRCHTIFHNNWIKPNYWLGKESGHWQVYSLQDTAKLCAMYCHEDMFLSKNYNAKNFCNKDAARECINRYYREQEIKAPVVIDPYDIQQYVRNKRYEMYFEAEKRGLTVEEFLDEAYGKKIRGKNPLRRDAGKKNGPFDHSPESFHKHYNENKNILKLMQEVKKYEKTKQL